MSKSNLVDAEIIVGVKEAATELGIDIVARMETLGLDPNLLPTTKGYISWTLFNDLLELVAKEEHCLYFGLLVAKHQPAIPLSLLGQMMKLCPTLGAAIKKGHQYNSTYSHIVYWESSIDNGFVTLSRKLYYPQTGTYGQSNTFGVAQVFKILKALTDNRLQATSVSFIHCEPDSYSQKKYNAFFNLQVKFNQENDSIIFPVECLQLPIPSADEKLLELLEVHAETLQKKYSINNDIVTNVRLIIRLKCSEPACNIVLIAQMLNLHPKTLHRRLKKYGVTFKQLQKEERHKLAQYYLSKSNIQLMQLAEMLGYSDASALSRSFKNQCGLSPHDWKIKHLVN